MTIFARAKSAAAYPQFNSYLSSLSSIYGQSPMANNAGEAVDEWSALGVSTVLGCVSLLADTTASMNLRTYEWTGTKKILCPLPEVLANPDPESNTYELIHQMVASMALHGNSYTLLTRDRRSDEVIGLLPLHPYQMQVLPDDNQSRRRYMHLGNDIASDDMLHQRWFTPPQSLVGISPLNQNRNLVGLSLALDRFVAQFYGEGGTPSGVLSFPNRVTPENAQILSQTWSSSHRKHRKIAVLDQGGKFEPIHISAADQQLIQMREQIVRDIARVFRIPSHLIGATGDNQTYQNVEQASLNFLTHTMQPWLRRLESNLTKVLPAGISVEFDTSSLLRSDALTRAKYNQLHINMGAITPNEVRLVEGRDPYEGGDVFNQSMMGKTTAGGELPSLGTDDGPDLPSDAAN